MLPSAATSSSEMKPSTTPTPRYFVSSAVSVKDGKRCCSIADELLRVHTVVGRMDVDEKPTGLSVLDCKIGVVRRLLGSIAIEVRLGLAAL